MQVVYKKWLFSTNIWSITSGSNVPSTVHYRLWHICVRLRRPSTRCTQMALCHALVEISFITDAVSKILKMQNILLKMDYPGGH